MDSPKLKKGWSLTTQMKMYSHAVDSIQKTFIEALAQARFSTGAAEEGRIRKQKYNAK